MRSELGKIAQIHMALSAGTRLGPYEILLLLGAGGMGEVYRCQDTRLNRTVAVKVLPAHLAEHTAHSIAVAVAFAIITAAEIVFGELAPKWIALERPEATAIWLVRPLELFMRVFWPFIRLVHGTAQGVIKMLGLRGADHRAGVHSEEELKMLVTASQEAGVLEEQEEQMLHRVFGFSDLTAGQVMIPRTELIAVAADTPLRELMRKIGQGEPTRLPVYREDLDDVIGMLHVEASRHGYGELGMLVDRAWRGRGVGSALLAAAADWARDQGLHKLCLEVFAHNAAAIAAYRKAGYTEEGRRVAQYRRASGELWDTIVMGLLL